MDKELEVRHILKDMCPTPIGPFQVYDLTDHEDAVNKLSRLLGQNGLENVPSGCITEAHTHDQLSFYLIDGLCVQNGSQRFDLPKQALVEVPPGVVHCWSPQGQQSGHVGSVGHQHPRQLVQALAP